MGRPTDVRELLADTLETAFLEVPAGVNDESDWASYLADVLLSLSSIAIVQLPEPNSSGRWVDGSEIAQVLPKSSGMAITLRSPNLVRKIAAVLLAAADAAEVMK